MIDQDAVFRSIPTAYLLMDLDLVIVVSSAIPELDSVGAPYFAVLFLMDEVIAPLFD